MTNVLISLLSRLLSLPPLMIVFYAVFRTYWEKINKINGLRRTRVFLLSLLLALIIDNIIFLYVAIQSLCNQNPIITLPTYLAFFDKVIITLSFYGFYYLFRHASKKDQSDKV